MSFAISENGAVYFLLRIKDSNWFHTSFMINSNDLISDFIEKKNISEQWVILWIDNSCEKGKQKRIEAECVYEIKEFLL